MKKFAVNNKSTSQNIAEIIFSGYLVLENIEAIRNDLLKLIKNKSKVTINFENISDIDLAFMQLLIVFENDKKYKNVSVNYETIEKQSSFDRYFENLKLEKNGN